MMGEALWELSWQVGSGGRDDGGGGGFGSEVDKEKKVAKEAVYILPH